jgi:hypothetical protein
MDVPAGDAIDEDVEDVRSQPVGIPEGGVVPEPIRVEDDNVGVVAGLQTAALGDGGRHAGYGAAEPPPGATRSPVVYPTEGASVISLRPTT